MEDPNNNTLLDRINTDPNLNATDILNNFLHEDDNVSQLFVTNLKSNYFDISTDISLFSKL